MNLSSLTHLKKTQNKHPNIFKDEEISLKMIHFLNILKPEYFQKIIVQNLNALFISDSTFLEQWNQNFQFTLAKKNFLKKTENDEWVAKETETSCFISFKDVPKIQILPLIQIIKQINFSYLDLKFKKVSFFTLKRIKMGNWLWKNEEQDSKMIYKNEIETLLTNKLIQINKFSITNVILILYK